MARLISRKEALASGLKRYFTGKPCKNGHVAQRKTRNSDCCACRTERARRRMRRWRAEHPGAHSAAERRRRAKNPEAVRAVERRRYARDPEGHRARRRRWRQDNPAKINANVKRRKLSKINRTPAWADHDKIAEVYALAAFATELTGVPHHVDHEIPLQSRFVSGLHVHTNLRVVPGVENLRKHNKFAPYAEHYATADEIAVAMIPC